MELSPSLEKICKGCVRKSKASKRSIDQDFKECAELVQYNQSIGTSFLGGLFEIANCENKKPSNAQIQCLLSGQEHFRMPKGTVRSWYAGGYANAQSLMGQKDLSSCYEILGVSPEASFPRD